MNQHITALSSPASLDRIITARRIALEKVRQAKHAEELARLALSQIGLAPRFELQHERRSVNATLSDDELARALHIDRDIWLTLHQRVMGQVQTSTQREAQEQAIYQGDYPPVTAEAILETLRGYQAGAEQAYIQSVYDFWQSLHARYASNDAPSFGPKQVLTYACEPSHQTGAMRLTRRAAGRLEDLTHIMGMYAAQGMDTEVKDAPEAWAWSRHETGRWLDFGAFSIKVFKNGNMHLRLREDVCALLNQTLATAAGKRLHTAA